MLAIRRMEVGRIVIVILHGYADAKEFPIFVTEDPSADLCSLTIKLHDYIKDIERAEFGDKEIGALLNTPIPREEVKTSAMRMNPSFLPQITAIYCHKESFLSDEEYESIVTGKKCTPKSLYEFMSPNYKEFGEKRFYGSKEQIKER